MDVLGDIRLGMKIFRTRYERPHSRQDKESGLRWFEYVKKRSVEAVKDIRVCQLGGGLGV